MALLLLGPGIRGFAQNILPFDEALQSVLTYLTGRIATGSTVAVLSFQSEYPNLSEYVIDDITSGLVNTDLYTIVDRRSLELLAQEMAFQLSGEVSDETALAIGRRLGAQTVISGAVTYLGEFYRLRVQAIEVETARIQGSQTVSIQPSRTLSALVGTPGTPPPVEPVYVPPVVVEPARPDPTPTRTPAPASNTSSVYLGLRGGFSAHLHYPNSDFWDYPKGEMSYPYFSGEATAQMSVQLGSLLAVQAETVFLAAGDTFQIPTGDQATFSYSAMMLPLLGKITLRPGSVLLAGFGGIYFTIPLSPMIMTVNGMEYSYSFTGPMGFIAGGNIGIRLGSGTLFLDLRYADDLSDTEIHGGGWGVYSIYKRSMIFISLGYEFGFGG
jgi:TolB-like protein